MGHIAPSVNPGQARRLRTGKDFDFAAIGAELRYTAEDWHETKMPAG